MDLHKLNYSRTAQFSPPLSIQQTLSMFRSFIAATIVATTSGDALAQDLSAGEPQSPMLAGIQQAQHAFHTGKSEVETKYRKAFAEAIRDAKEIDVFLLDFEMTAAKSTEMPGWAETLPKDQFPITPYRSQSKILESKRLRPREIALLMPALQRTIAVQENHGGAFCHMPIHGIRIWNADQIVFQTSICYECMNWYMTYPYADSGWLALSEPNLQNILEQLMPIPQKEKDRFKAKYGKK